MRRFLCPTDFSELSSRAAEHGIAVARAYRAELTLLHVYTPALLPTGVVPYLAERTLLEPVTPERLRRELRGFAERLRPGDVPVTVEVVEGNPVAEILRHAESFAADLIVMGTHGAGGFERWVLGSVTEKVLRKSSRTVLTVPRGSSAPAAGGRARLRTVLCAVDFSEASLAALDCALGLASRALGKLVALHVLEGIAPATEAGPAAGELRREAEDRLREAVPPGSPAAGAVEAVVAAGKAHQEILRVARERGADLLVMGPNGVGSPEPGQFGSTAHHVVREAVSPVLTVRKPS